jgi:hypothetical protein
VSTVLARCAERLRQLRPDWSDPSKYLAERDQIVRLLELEAAGQRRDVVAPNFYRQPEPGPDESTRRLMALLAFKDGEIDRLRRLLAQARPRPRRRRVHDERQLALIFVTERTL